MKKLTKLERFGLIAAIVVGGSYFYMKRVYDPEAAALQGAVRQLNSTVASYNKMKEPPPLGPLKEQVSEQMKELERMKVELKKAGGRTGEAAEVTEVLSLVTQLIKEENMRVLKISPEGDVEDKLFTWAVFSIRMGGRYQDFVTLVTQFKELRQPVQLRDLNMERNEGSPGFIIVTAKLLI